MEPQRQVSGTKVWNWRLQTFDVWNQKLKKSNLVLDLVKLTIINGQKHICYIFSPGWSLCRGVGSCHAELSPTWTFSRQTQTLARPSENKICLRNVIWILHRCWKSFVNALQMYFQQWGVLSLKLERLRILEKLILEKFFPEISNSFGNKTFFFFWMRCLSEFK